MYDIVIIGGGLSGMISADRLLGRSDPSLRVAIVEPILDSLKKRTFSSWRKKNEPRHPYAELVSRSWSRFRVIAPDGARIDRDFECYTYEMISGEHLHDHLSRKLDADPRFERIQARAVEVVDGKGGQVRLDTGRLLTASQVLSSPARHPGALGQYFWGWMIEVDQDFPPESIDPDRVGLMDFGVPQKQGVRFIYTLPFSTRSALVEFTTFSVEPPNEAEILTILKEYLTQTLGLGSYRISGTESGEIPMGIESEPLFPPSFGHSAIQSVGAAFSRVKPSTGYSFERNLQITDLRLRAFLRSYFGFRFRIYDAILLEMIRSRGETAARNLSRLFERNPPSRVFAFLDERTSPTQELRIFQSLEWLPFGRILLGLYPFPFSVGVTLMLHHYFNPPLDEWLGLSLPVIGLLTIGIGHGSLDHLLLTPNRDVRAASFYLRYLGKMGLFFLLWYLSPLLALMFFIAQSADHFGESYWLRVLARSSNDRRVRSLTWLWGLFASLFGVMLHWEQALPILSALLRGPRWLGWIQHSDSRIAAVGLALLATFAAGVLDRYDHRSSGRAPSGVPATLLLAASIAVLPLLHGFLCFFAFWHGWDTLRESRVRKGWTTHEYVKRALPWTGVAVVTLAAGAFLTGFSHQTLAFLFVLLGGLTAAHAPVMKRFLMSVPTGGRKIST